MNTFFLDMDGVIADWNAGVGDFIGYRLNDPKARYPEADWEKIRTHQRVFRDLPKMSRADDIVNLARNFRDQLGYELLFLTAIPHYNDIFWEFYDKVLWAQERYPDIPVHFGPYSEDKQKHCKPGDILVDDRYDNCDNWESVGGIAIRVTAQDKAVNDITELFRNTKR